MILLSYKNRSVNNLQHCSTKKISFQTPRLKGIQKDIYVSELSVAQSQKNWCRDTIPTLGLSHYLRNRRFRHQRLRYYPQPHRA